MSFSRAESEQKNPGPGDRITRSEAARILQCSLFKIRALEKAGKLPEPEKVDGTYTYPLDAVRELAEALESGGPEDRGLVRYEPDAGASMVRAASLATREAVSGSRSLFSYFQAELVRKDGAHEKEVTRLRDRITQLEAERASYTEKMEKLLDRAAERDLERRMVEHVAGIGEGSGAGKQFVDKAIVPLVPILMQRIMGLKSADPKDPVGQRVKAFAESLTEEQTGLIMGVLEESQRTALMDLIAFVQGAPEAKK